jgi:hypothetical protein
MAFVFRDFDIFTNEYGDKGNIEISVLNDNTLNVLVFGINGGYGHSYIKVTISNNLDLYENCKIILDKITNDYKYNVYMGYKDYIKFDNNAVYKINDNELIELLHLCTIETLIYGEVSSCKDDTDCAFVMRKDVNNETTYQIDFNKQNTKYLNIYKLNYQYSLEKELGVIYGMVSLNGIFNYDKELLDSNDDTDFSINDDCSTESIV